MNPAALHRDIGDVDARMAAAAKTVSATYKYHYNGYVPIGPQCRDRRRRRKDGATVFVSGQSINTVPQTSSTRSPGSACR